MIDYDYGFSDYLEYNNSIGLITKARREKHATEKESIVLLLES